MQTQTEMQREVDEAVRTMRAGGIILYPVSYTHLTLPTTLVV